MCKHTIFFLFAILLSFEAKAKVPVNNSLKGTVKDNHGNPLPGAVVEVPDLKVGTVADSTGHYIISNLPKGKFIIIASLISYSKTTVTISINGEMRQDFILNESAIESQEVVITGQSKATEINRSPVPVVAINNQYLRTNASTNIIDAIAKVPGVSEVTTGPNVSKPVIRGLGYNRILTLYNGMRQEGQQWGDEHGMEVDEYGIDRIELVKGPSSLIYGSDALAGVVNLIPTPHAPDGKIIGEVVSEYQTNNGLIGGSGMLSGNKNGFYWLGRVSDKLAKNYQDPIDGRVYGTNYHETDLSGSFGLNKKWGFAHLDVSLFDDLQAIPDGSRDSASRRFTKQITEADTTMRPKVSDKELNSYTIPVLHQHVQHYRVLSSNSFNVLNDLLVINVGFERSVRREFSHPQYPDIAGLFLQLNSYTYDLKYHVHSIKGWDITAGLNGMYQTNDVTKGTDFIIPSYHQFDLGPFATIEKNMGKLNIAGGIRYDSRTFHNDALNTKPDPVTGFDTYVPGNDTAGLDHPFFKSDHTFSGMTYSLGLTYIFSKHVAIKGNISRGFRAPNIVEISANGVHPGTYIYQLGNADFKPEFSLQEDLGMEYSSRHLSVNVSVFNNDIANYIYNQKILNSSGRDSIISGNTLYQFQQGGAKLYGGEADIDIHPHPFDWLHFENTISLVYGLNTGANSKLLNDSAKYLPFIPPLHFISELRANFKQPSKYLRNTFIKIQAVVYAKQDRVYLVDNTETPTPGYTLFNAGIGSDITSHAGKILFNISLFGNNLFDVAYQDHLSRPKYFEEYPNDPRGHLGIYNMGRNIGIKLTVPFGVK